MKRSPKKKNNGRFTNIFFTGSKVLVCARQAANGGQAAVKGERLADSLKDLACYCVMTLMEISEENNLKKQEK